ncbi:oligosaccharide flippase family protein [Pseudomonas sp. ArH3a]|uniref:oligosaccharide flippase family protein n=1 Tax=Pseudomonas sp. ArH3a TaxID=2862945 RepID=UPI001F59E535|nr:oligosaccharide flippase family protein [Pseudomonas sp. ArH3a]UNM21773.1 oligosaccharide flippase family protein [Pseudomonas sp. ArH3a]
MSVLFKNISANFLGQGWIAFMGICFVPLYLKFIGVEGYGLVGFFIILSSAMTMFDGGFGAVATREASKYETASAAERLKVILTLKSVECIFWGVAITVGTGVILLAPMIAEYWLTVSLDKIQSVTQSLRIMGVALLLQFPIALYYGSLIGLQRHVTLNSISSFFATTRAAGAALVLWIVSPTVEAFLIWQAINSLATVLVLRMKLVNGLPEWKEAGLFSLDIIQRLGGFAAGVGITNILAFLLMQVDKIILSKILPLKDFGCYMLAWTVGSVAFRLISPIFNVYYPKLVSLVAAQNTADTFHTFTRASQVLSLLVIPFSLWVAMYSHPLMLFWTRDETVATQANAPLMVLAIGTMLYSFMQMPYALQLAHGWTRFSVWQNATAVVFMVPLTYYLATHYGLNGSAWPWLILNVGYVAICSPIIFRKLKVRPASTWYAEAILIPAAIAFSSLLAMKMLFDTLAFNNLLTMAFSLGVTYVLVGLRIFTFRFTGRKIEWRNTL